MTEVERNVYKALPNDQSKQRDNTEKKDLVTKRAHPRVYGAKESNI